MAMDFQAKYTFLRRPRPALWLNAIVLAVCLMAAGCAAGCAPALASLPVSGQASGFQVHEYALIEQSTDNPTHARFEERVPAAVAAARAGMQFPGDARSGDDSALAQANDILAPFGYHLAPNQAPPFSAYTLYSGEDEIQTNIAQFWAVSRLGSPQATANADFLLPFVTMDGQRLAASTQGIHPWSDQGSATGPSLVYADTGASEAGGVGGLAKVRAAAPPKAATANQVVTQNQHVIVNGVDLNKVSASDDVFNWQIVNGQPLYFYARNGVIHLNYAGSDLPYTYDRVIHGNQGDTAIFNPGKNARMVWFYALRDGLWYYIEAGNFGQ